MSTNAYFIALDLLTCFRFVLSVLLYPNLFSNFAHTFFGAFQLYRFLRVFHACFNYSLKIDTVKYFLNVISYYANTVLISSFLSDLKDFNLTLTQKSICHTSTLETAIHFYYLCFWPSVFVFVYQKELCSWPVHFKKECTCFNNP